MSGQLPDTVKPFSLAENGQTLGGEIALAKMQRLAGLLSSNQGTVEASLDFGLDEQGIPYLKGHVKATLELICQRCMQSMQYPLDTTVNLAIAHSATEAERLPTHYEPLVVESPILSLVSVIEDELILVLPIVAMHDEVDCKAAKTVAVGSAVEKPNPFAVLAKLKGRTETQR